MSDIISLWFTCFIAGFLVPVVPAFVMRALSALLHIFTLVSGAGGRIGGEYDD